MSKDPDAVDQVVARLRAARPLPSAALRTTVRQRFADVNLPHRPAHLVGLVSILATAAVLLLVLALLGALQIGPLG